MTDAPAVAAPKPWSRLTTLCNFICYSALKLLPVIVHIDRLNRDIRVPEEVVYVPVGYVVLSHAVLEMSLKSGQEAVEGGAYVDVWPTREIDLPQSTYLDADIHLDVDAEAVGSLDRHTLSTVQPVNMVSENGGLVSAEAEDG